jgi:large subunit ribosomal protein L19
MNNSTTNNKTIKQNFESLYLKDSLRNLETSYENIVKPGAIIRIAYKIPEGEKERIQHYEGTVISKQNRSISKTFKIRRSVQGIGVEQTFLANSPKIVSIVLKQLSKVRRAKLYFLRNLQGKSARLKIKS